jgi:acyl transferase domain-containing protein
MKSWPGTLELHDTVWMKPVVIPDRRSILISLAAQHTERSGAQVDYQIYSDDRGAEIVHCKGRAVFDTGTTPSRLNIPRLRAQMNAGELGPSEIYPAFEQSGLHYGPAHRGITAIYRGDGQLLAKLRLPTSVGSTGQDYLLHPSMMDSAVQALIGLMEDLPQLSDKPLVPFALRYLHVVSGCTHDMWAWVRHSPGGSSARDITSVDIDVCDADGNVCVLMRGLASRILHGSAVKAPAASDDSIEHTRPVIFDSNFYQTVIDRILSKEISVEEATRL